MNLLQRLESYASQIGTARCVRRMISTNPLLQPADVTITGSAQPPNLKGLEFGVYSRPEGPGKKRERGGMTGKQHRKAERRARVRKLNLGRAI